MNKVNKSFLYLFPIIYQELVDELTLDYKIFQTNNWLVTLKKYILLYRHSLSICN